MAVTDITIDFRKLYIQNMIVWIFNVVSKT